MMKFPFLALFSTMVAYGCATTAAPVDTGNHGGHGEPCYVDGSCNAGLTCVSNLCVSGSGLDGGGQETSVPNDSSTPDDSGGGDAGCSAPGKLFAPKPPNSVYCPFTSPTASCNPSSQHCCEPTSGTATCTPTATPCGSADIDWQCQDPAADCGNGMQCCGTGTFVTNSNPSCANYAAGFKGTHCASSCASTEITMCSASAECGTPKTCVPFKTHGAQVGGCN